MTKTNIKRPEVVKAIKLAGSQSALAAIVGVKQQNIAYWLHHGIPPKHVFKIEHILKMGIYELLPNYEVAESSNYDTNQTLRQA